MSAPSRNTVWARALVEELARAGVRELVLAPGSRSTPLVLAAAAEGSLRIVTHLDERSAAFLALGIGKAAGRPAAVLTTSGTAAANALPAVVEADLAETPLLVLTADRPARLRDADANQTIDQLRLFGPRVRAFVELPAPEVGGPALRHLRGAVARAVAAAVGLPAGPVHVNVPFAKPLEPVEAPGDVPPGFPDEHGRAWRGRPDAAPWVRVTVRRPIPSSGELVDLAGALAGARRGLLVAGPVPDPERVGPAAVRLAAASGLPLLADPLSGARFGAAGDVGVVGGYDLALARPDVRGRLTDADLILRVGRSPTSAALNAYLEEATEARQVVIDPGDRWKDHQAVATDWVRADAATTLDLLADGLRGGARGAAAGPAPPPPGPGDDPARHAAGPDAGPGTARAAWRDLWTGLEAAVRAALSTGRGGPFYEGLVLARVAAALPAGTTLFVSSSMPVRDLDAFAVPRAEPLLALGNRGASGIDGIVSTALGVAAVRGPVVAVLGDLAFYHDMNGLLATREAGLDVVFVVVHNDGGGIFHLLPVREHEPWFTRHFATPHGLDFAHAAALYGLPYQRVEGGDAALAGALGAALAAGGSRVLVVGSDREANRVRRAAVAAEVGRAVEAALAVRGRTG